MAMEPWEAQARKEDTNARNGYAHSYEETAQHFGISRQGVYNIERRALEKLRKALKYHFGITSVKEMLP